MLVVMATLIAFSLAGAGVGVGAGAGAGDDPPAGGVAAAGGFAGAGDGFVAVLPQPASARINVIANAT